MMLAAAGGDARRNKKALHLQTYRPAVLMLSHTLLRPLGDGVHLCAGTCVSDSHMPRICAAVPQPSQQRLSDRAYEWERERDITCRRGGAAFAKPKHSSSFRATSSQPVRTSSQLCRTDGSRLPTCSQRPSSVAAAFMACKASSGNSTCCAAAACVGGRAPGMDFHLLAASSMRSFSGRPPRRCAIVTGVSCRRWPRSAWDCLFLN